LKAAVEHAEDTAPLAAGGMTVYGAEDLVIAGMKRGFLIFWVCWPLAACCADGLKGTTGYFPHPPQKTNT